MAEDRTRPLGGLAVAAAQRPRDLGPGMCVGEWTIVRRIGGGGFGGVYEVRHRETQQPAALKILHAHLVTSAEMLGRFEREIQVIKRLDHPNVVQLVAAGFSDDGCPFLCMELLDGEDLYQVIRRRGRLPIDEALAILDALCEALATAHERGIVHRDIKAGNVQLCRPASGEALGRVVLLDFGIAKISDAFATELTATSQSLGTPSCMAPEQIYGRRADARTDIYALGGLLFHMLTGQMPLQDESPTMTQYLHLHARRPRASALAAIPARLDDIVIRAMAIDPSDRYADAIEMAAAARAATRTSAMHQAVESRDACAILVGVRDRSASAGFHAAVLGDLEAVLPDAERALAGAGFALAVDLGSSALFVARVEPDVAVHAARAAWDQLAQIPRHPRVQIAICVHRGPLLFYGGELQASPLLRPSTWPIADPAEGLWVTAAASATPGRLA